MGSRIALFLLLIVPLSTLAGLVAAFGMVAILANFTAYADGLTQTGMGRETSYALLAAAVIVTFFLGMGGGSLLIWASWRRLFGHHLNAHDGSG